MSKPMEQENIYDAFIRLYQFVHKYYMQYHGSFDTWGALKSFNSIEIKGVAGQTLYNSSFGINNDEEINRYAVISLCLKQTEPLR